MAVESNNTESITALRDWMAHPVTREFWGRLKLMADDGDAKCHVELSKGAFQEAAHWNAYVDALREIIEMPEEMISEKREEAK